MKLLYTTNGFAFALAAATIQRMMSSASGIATEKIASSDGKKRALRLQRKPKEDWKEPAPPAEAEPWFFPAPSPAPPPITPTPPHSSCPSGSDFEFVYEGVAGIACETMSFYLLHASEFPDVEYYSYSLAGLGNDIRGNENIGLTAYANPLIHEDNAPNYIFVAKVQVEGCPQVISRCTLDCVPGGPSPSQPNPPFCDF